MMPVSDTITHMDYKHDNGCLEVATYAAEIPPSQSMD